MLTTHNYECRRRRYSLVWSPIKNQPLHEHPSSFYNALCLSNISFLKRISNLLDLLAFFFSLILNNRRNSAIFLLPLQSPFSQVSSNPLFHISLKPEQSPRLHYRSSKLQSPFSQVSSNALLIVADCWHFYSHAYPCLLLRQRLRRGRPKLARIRQRHAP